MQQVFVSYSSRDETIVRERLKPLITRGVTCWLAADCVPGGEDFAKLVEDAISRSKIVLLMATRNALSSSEVLRELILADKKGIPVVPLVLERDLTLEKGFDYRLAGKQHIAAVNPDDSWTAAVVRALEYYGNNRTPDALEGVSTRHRPNVSSGLLPYMANRETQELLIQQTLEEHLIARPQRPLCLIVHGEESHCCDMFAERLSKHSIPSYLKRISRSDQLEVKPIRWPEYSVSAATAQPRASLYWKTVFDRLELPLTAPPADLFRRLITLRRPALFCSILGKDAWQPNEMELIRQTLATWATIPDLPAPSQPLMVLLSVSYAPRQLSLIDRVFSVPMQSEVALALMALRSPQETAITVKVLPELTSLSLSDVENWTREMVPSDEVDDVLFVLRAIFMGRRKDAETRISHLTRLGGRESTLAAIIEGLLRHKSRARLFPMQPLAPLLKQFVSADIVLRSI
jgi:inactive STAND/TIR domain